MTPQRRSQIISHLEDIVDEDEVALFVAALGKNKDGAFSEAQDSEVFAASHRRKAELKKRKGKK
jgi:hypothetical protein